MSYDTKIFYRIRRRHTAEVWLCMFTRTDDAVTALDFHDSAFRNPIFTFDIETAEEWYAACLSAGIDCEIVGQVDH